MYFLYTIVRRGHIEVVDRIEWRPNRPKDRDSKELLRPLKDHRRLRPTFR